MTTCTVCELHAESTFRVEGMDCREEVAMLERRFKNLAGLEGFSADLIGQRLHVKYDAAKLTTATIADAVADTGMRAWLEHEEPVVGNERQARVRQALVWTSGIALGIGLAMQLIDGTAAAGGTAKAVPYVPFAIVRSYALSNTEISLTAGGFSAAARRTATPSLSVCATACVAQPGSRSGSVVSRGDARDKLGTRSAMRSTAPLSNDGTCVTSSAGATSTTRRRA